MSAPDVRVPDSEVEASASVPGVSVSAPDLKATGEVDVKAPEMPSVDTKKSKGSILGSLIRKHSSRSKVEVRLNLLLCGIICSRVRFSCH